MYNYIYNLSLIKKYLFICFGMHIISAYFSLGFYKDDEHFQILEPIAYLLGYNNVFLNDNGYWYWEWAYGMRPWSQSYIYYYIISFIKFFNINDPFVWAFYIKIFSSILGYFSIVYLFYTFKNIFIKKINHFNLFIFFTFWFYPFLHSRTSSENLGITCFIFAFCFLYKLIITKEINYNNNFINIFFGILLGLSLVFRLNLIFTILPILAWVLIFRFEFKKILVISLGVLISLSVGVIVDSLNYNQFTIPYWNFFYWNIIWGRMADFGAHPWWFYFTSILLDLAPFLSVIFLIGLVLYWIKNPLSLFTCLTFFTLIIISLFSHKEIRYAFPIYVFAPFFIIYFVDSLKENKFSYFLKIILIFSNIIFLSLTLFTPANGKVALYKYLNEKEIQNKTVYFIDENPYLINAMEPFFYTHVLPKINEIKIENISKIDNLKDTIIITNNYFHYKKIINNYNCEKLYSSFPETIINLNKIGKNKDLIGML